MSEVIEKVRKLLALGKSDNENEAAAAMAAADKLIRQHRLAVADIEDQPESKQDEAAIDSVPILSGKVLRWKLLLLSVLCSRNGCVNFKYSSGSKWHYALVGKQSDVEMVKYLFAFAVHSFTRIYKTKFSNLNLDPSFRQGWYYGAVVGVREQLDASKKADPNMVKSLAIIDKRKSEAEDVLHKAFETKTQQQKVPKINEAGYLCGKHAGLTLNLKQKELSD